jgi:hypothetical protein
MEDIMNNIINKLLAEGKVTKHYTFESTGIVCGNCRKISGSAGIDVNHFYIYPQETQRKQIEVCYNNTHYGYAHFDEEGHICDNSNRSIFEIV